MEALPDWDLLAVVRSCRNTTTTSITTTVPPTDVTASPPEQLPPLPILPPQRENLCFSPTSVSTTSSCSTNEILFRFPNPFGSPTTSLLSGHQDLQDICNKPLICSTTTTTTSTSCTTTGGGGVTNSFSSPVSSSSSSFLAGRSFSIADQTQLRRPIEPSSVVFGAPSATSISQSQRTKKRKNLMKKVCHVPAEGVSTDMWAWRKYGQKPIKGSPYPRGYYRCSSSKGCVARKQVERNRSDPKMFIVTYTAEHNHPMPTHRNSLAGSSRQKPLSSAGTPPEQPTCSSPSAASLSPLTEKTEADNEMGISDLMLNDDFYVGFEQIDADADGNSFSDQFSPPMELPWLSSNSGSTATAAGGS